MLFNIRCLAVRTTSTSGYSNLSHANVPRPVSDAYLEKPELNSTDTLQLDGLARKMEQIDIDINGCAPGQYNHLLCPKCKGGDTAEKSLSLFIDPGWQSALWKCFRAKCGWEGNMKAQADVNSSYARMNKITKASIRAITEDDLGLEPLCDEV